jgi:hypothetical protein
MRYLPAGWSELGLWRQLAPWRLALSASLPYARPNKYRHQFVVHDHAALAVFGNVAIKVV